jgi:uncharacterized membrane-anchored protein YitT (DUF2179 family)
LEPIVKTRAARARAARFLREIRGEWKAFLAITAGVTVQAVAVTLFVLPNRFPDLGVSGIAVLAYYVFGISPAWVILGINLLLMIWAWRELSPRFVMWTMWAVLLFSVLLKAFEYVPVPVIGDRFMAAVVSGVVRGLGAGLIFRVGGSTGGLDIPGVALRRRYGIEMGQFSIYINTGLLSLSFFVVGLESAIYGAVALYVYGIVVDNSIRSFDRRKQVFIITNIPERVSEYINISLQRGTTRFEGVGGYSGQRRPVLMTLLEPRQVVALKKYLAVNDPKAFMSVSVASEVLGKGFKSWKSL